MKEKDGQEYHHILDPRLDPDVMVSVCIVTYNHEKFVGKAIESVLEQETDFKVELIIGDDCSTDLTSSILKEYEAKFPGMIHLIIREKRGGLKANYVDVLMRARGKYVATLEGDDFWTDKYKLAKQVRFLENNPKYILVCTNALKFTVDKQGGTRAIGLLRNVVEPFDFDTRDLMIGNPGSTLTAVFRNGILRQLPEIFFQSSACDRRLYLLLSRYGKCRLLPDVTAAYRIHPSSITALRSSTYEGQLGLLQEQIRNAEMWNLFFDGAYSPEVALVRETVAKTAVRLALTQGHIMTAARFADTINPKKLKSRKAFVIVHILRVLWRGARHFTSSEIVSRSQFDYADR